MKHNTTVQPLTNREFDIMNILWQSETALVASEIAKQGTKLTINTVQAVLKKLMSRNLIKVDEIVYSGTVLTRSYVPTITSDEFELNHLVASFNKISEDQPLTTSCFVATLLEQEKDSRKLLTEIEQLEQLLESKKQQLKKDKR